MCGIFILLDDQVVSIHALSRLLRLIDNRGPDYQSPLTTQGAGSFKFHLRCSILHLRGTNIQEQPVIDDDHNVLMFNGQIYLYEAKPLQPCESDTSFLSRKLQDCSSPVQIVETLSKIEGPFAVVYWHSKSNTLIYSRDFFGRKSLCALAHRDSSIPIIISTIADDNLATNDLSWSEVSCEGCHCIDLTDNDHPRTHTYHWDLDKIYPRTAKCQETHKKTTSDKLISIPYLVPLNADSKSSSDFDQTHLEKTIDDLENRFLEAVRSRIDFHNTTCLDCRRSQIAQCCHAKVAVAFSGGIDSTMIALALDKMMDKDASIDLITVAFKPESPDRLSVGCAFRELMLLSPDRKWRLILCDVSKSELQATRNATIRNLILPCKSVFDDGIGCACWFVGRARGRALDATTSQHWLRTNFESFLRYDPLSKIVDHVNVHNYTSPASILYAGSSIDEQLGGYSSHRAAWSRFGAKGLVDEVSFLMRRLSSRNLGRDDRTYCDHGRDIKLPFLSYEFVSFLNQLPISVKMNLDEPLDIGPKKILRLLALRWGLNKTGRRVKRAMQFGTRIANLENNKEKGDQICARLVKLDDKFQC